MELNMNQTKVFNRPYALYGTQEINFLIKDQFLYTFLESREEKKTNVVNYIILTKSQTKRCLLELNKGY